MAKWHENLVRTVLDTGQLVMPTGRIFVYDRADVAKRLWFHRPKILNYPVQGTGADLVAIGRVTLWKRLRQAGLPVLFVSTVHDSIDLDVPYQAVASDKIKLDKDMEVVYNICRVIKQSVEDVPTNFFRLFGKVFDLPISADISYGPNLQDLTPFESK